MISDPDRVRYVCVGRRTNDGWWMILAEYNVRGLMMQTLAQDCLERTPPNHAVFCHNVYKITYTFLIDGPFAYLAICDSSLPKFDRMWLLDRVKDAAQPLIAKRNKAIEENNERFTWYCFQMQIQPIFYQLLCNFGSKTDNRRLSSSNGIAGGKKKAKKVWKRYVWVVMVLDLSVFLILFGVWLVFCHGFDPIIMFAEMIDSCDA